MKVKYKDITKHQISTKEFKTQTSGVGNNRYNALKNYKYSIIHWWLVAQEEETTKEK